MYCALCILNKRRICDSTVKNLPRTLPFYMVKERLVVWIFVYCTAGPSFMRGFGPWYSETWLHYMSSEIDIMSLLYDYTRNAYSKLCDYAEIL